MARYDFTCPNNHTTEHRFPIGQPAESINCPKCGEQADRDFSRPGILDMGADGSKRGQSGERIYRGGKRQWN